MESQLFDHHIIKVPKFLICYYCPERNYLLLKGKLGVKLIKLELKIKVLKEKNLLFITDNPVLNSYNIRKKVRILQSKTRTLIKKSILEVTRRSYKKLKLIGVGFKLNYISNQYCNLLKLDLGFSHSVYYKVPNGIFVIVTSPTNFIIYGNSIDLVAAVSSKIRQLKLPEPYKGKGILYDSEDVVLKEVRKS